MRRALLALALLAGLMAVPSSAGATPLVVVTVGTSIEGGTGLPFGQSWPSRFAARCGCSLADRSLGGGAYTHDDPAGDNIRKHVDAAVAELHPDILILGGPVNDLVSLSLEQIGDLNLAVYNAAGAAYAAGVKRVIVLGILPMTDGGPGYAFPTGWWPSLEPRRQVYNTWAHDMWGSSYVDMSAWLKETSTARGERRWFRDGLHPNRVGAALIAEAFPTDVLSV